MKLMNVYIMQIMHYAYCWQEVVYIMQIVDLTVTFSLERGRGVLLCSCDRDDACNKQGTEVVGRG